MKAPRDSRRRRFLKSGAAALLGTWAVPEIVSSAALGNRSTPPASERITLAFIGPGNRGRGLVKEFAPRAEVEVLAVADVSAKPTLPAIHRVVNRPPPTSSIGTCGSARRLGDPFSAPSEFPVGNDIATTASDRSLIGFAHS